MGGPVFSITSSFSMTSGGRTAAVFQRATELASASRPVTILTFNFRTHYRDIEDVWRQRTGAGRYVHHLNMFEHFAGEPIYERSLGVMAYEPPSGIRKRYLEGQRAWVLGKGPERQMAFLNPDGSLMNMRHYHDGRKALRVDVDAQQRQVRRLHFAADHPEQAALIEYVTSDHRLYLETIRRGQDASDIAHDEHLAASSHRVTRVDGQVVDVESTPHLRARFIADLAERHRDAVFIVDDRGADDIVINNPYVSGIPAIASIHSAHRSSSPELSRNAAALRRSDEFQAVVVLTHEQAADAVSDGLVVQSPRVISHCAPARGKAWRRRRTDVVMIARLVAVKQVDHAIAAFALVVASRPDAHLTIWGTGELEEVIRDAVAAAGLEESITLAGHTAEPLQVLGSARLSISTSRSEGFGLVMSESLSQGTPVVSYRYSYGPRDMIEHGVNGLLVDQDDPAALAAGVLDLLSDPRRLRRMSRAASKSMRNFGSTRFRAEWTELLEQSRRSEV